MYRPPCSRSGCGIEGYCPLREQHRRADIRDCHTRQALAAHMRGYRLHEAELCDLLARMDAAEGRIPSADPGREAGGAAGGSSPVERAADIRIELRQRAVCLSGLLHRVRYGIERALCQLSVTDPQAALVLRRRYLGGLTVSQTAERVGYSERHVKRLQSRGLDSIAVYVQRWP